MGRLFGTDGIRGVVNKELTCELVFKIGQAGAYILTKEYNKSPEIVVGKDTRISCDMLESSLIAGLCSAGADVIRLGVLPTPAVAYLTRLYKADAGVMISASHNPMEYNGIKFFDAEGFKLKDKLEEKIENIVLNNNDSFNVADVADIGKVRELNGAYQDYLNFAKNTIDCDLSGLKIAIDCANGATYKLAGKIFSDLGAQVIALNNFPNGININKNCGSTNIDKLQKFVENNDFDVGIAFDGDGDRVLATDENGNLIDGDRILAICASYMKKIGKLKNNSIVATIMSNLGLKKAMEESEIELKQTSVGDRYVLEQMLKTGENLGGEQSGHIIFLDYNTTGDGIVSALQLLAIMKKTGKKLSELAKVMKVFPQVMAGAKVSENKKKLLSTDGEINLKIAEVAKKYKDTGRVLVRPSGTEPVVRVMIEGEDISVIKKDAEILAKLIENKLS